MATAGITAKEILIARALSQALHNADVTFDEVRDYLRSLAETVSIADLASTDNGEGASLIGVEDSAGNFAATDVEAALAEILSDLALTTASNGASLVGVQDAASNFTGTTVETVLAELATAATDAVAEVYLSSSAETTIAEAGTAVLLAGTTTLTTDPAAVDFTMPSNMRLTYGGTATKVFTIHATVSFTAAANNKTYSFYVAKGGVTIAASKVNRKAGTGADVGALPLQALVSLATDDYVEIYVANVTGADTTNLTATTVTLSATS